MRLTPFIHHSLTSPVWRMEIDESTDTLFLELRDAADKQVSFAGIDLSSAKLKFSGLVMFERWLTGIATAAHGVLLLHGFQSEALPVHKGLTGIDGSNGNVLWTDYNINFEDKAPDGFVVYDARIQPKMPFVIDQRTGQRTTASADPVMERVQSAIKLPEFLPASALPKELVPMEPFGNVIHYHSHNNFRIVSLHSRRETELAQYLYVFDDNDSMVFEDIINENIQKLQPEAFMNYKNKLIWLKNRSEIKVLNL